MPVSRHGTLIVDHAAGDCQQRSGNHAMDLAIRELYVCPTGEGVNVLNLTGVIMPAGPSRLLGVTPELYSAELPAAGLFEAEFAPFDEVSSA